MLKKLKLSIVSVLALSMFAAPMVAVPVSAQDSDTQKGLQCGSNFSLNQTDCGLPDAESDFQSLLTDIVNIISVIVGVVAVIMIIFGGFRYITSGGDSGKVGNAKNTILYALIGLVIVALAQFIVRFVLKQTADVSS